MNNNGTARDIILTTSPLWNPDNAKPIILRFTEDDRMAGPRPSDYLLRATWSSMISRCKPDGDKNYGGRGITVCDRWKNSYDNFVSDMGPKPGAEFSIDRINNSLGYEPGNCKWSTRQEQSRNKRNNVVIEHKGEKITLSALANKLNIPYSKLHNRHRRLGWTIEKSLL